jgi:hypothetical protein
MPSSSYFLQRSSISEAEGSMPRRERPCTNCWRVTWSIILGEFLERAKSWKGPLT